MSVSFNLGPPRESPFKLFLRSQFWSKAQSPPMNTNLEGKVAIVTGSTSGLGLDASRQLLSLGLSVLIMAVRSTKKGEQIAAKFRFEYPNANIYVWELEMESYDSVQNFARQAESSLSRLDIVILNAAVQSATFDIIHSTGHERLIQVNYLSTMLLAILLLPSLKNKSPKGEPGRLSIVSSGTARGAVLSGATGVPILKVLDDETRPWKPVERYAVSKLLGHLFMVKLSQYVNPEDVVINLVDPGLVKDTNLQGFAPLPVAIYFYCFKGIFGRSLSIGASTYVDAIIVKGKDSHGCVVSNWEISP
jgi:NAD(P)-dependent dehydrogenase (short-subunit alcohol dehydrogenase family)